MGGSSGGSNTQTNDPWSQQAPFLQAGFNQSQNLYNTGGAQYFPGATYTPFSSQTEQGLGMAETRALGGSPVTSSAQNFAVNQLQNSPTMGPATSYLNQGPSLGAYNQFTQADPQSGLPGAFTGAQGVQNLGDVGAGVQSLGAANSVAGVGTNTGVQDLASANQAAGVGGGIQNTNAANSFAGVSGPRDLQSSLNPFTSQLSGVPSTSQNALEATAQGQNLQGNPYLDQQFDLAADRVTERFNTDISPGIAAQFSLAGRTGSDAQGEVQTRAAGEVSDSLANLASGIYGGNYQAERDRQLSAANSLGSLSQNQQGLGLQAAGQGADFFNQGQAQDISRRGLAADVFNQGQAQDISRRGLSLDAFNQGQSQDISRRGLAADVFNQGQSQDISRRSLESQNRLASAGQQLDARGQDINASLTTGQQDISRLGLAGSLYNQEQGNLLQAAGIDAGVYGNQLNQQNQVLGQANDLANQDYTDIGQLLNVGGAVEGLSNQALQDQISRFNYYQNLPQNNLANYIASIQGNYGGTTTSDAPQGPSRGQSALAGASTGMAIGGPWGAAIGAAGGYFLGG